MSVNTHSLDLEKSSSQYTTGGDYLDGITTLTVACWVKVESDPTDGMYYICSKWNQLTQPVNTSWRFTYRTSGNIAFEMYNSGTTFSDWLTTTNTMSLANWFHVAVVYDDGASPKATLYINGTSRTTTSGSTTGGTIQATTSNFRVGQESNLSDPRYFDGLINDLRTWSRALSSSEITDLYNNGCTFSNGSSLEGWWYVENDHNDDSGNSRNLTATGSPSFSTDVGYICAGGGSKCLLMGVGT